MNKESKDRLRGILIVPLVLTIVLVPYSLVIGWNLITLILFWFVLTPGLTIYFPSVISGQRRHLLESLVGLIVFYAFMVFIIYSHYKTDYFRIMIISCVINLIVVSGIIWIMRPKAEIQ
ncbi:MAG: hypothetical protein IPL46_34645 [Saprospiraceae bacterium]|nr:hypothetical protein [Saprospiraceae bacterium]